MVASLVHRALYGQPMEMHRVSQETVADTIERAQRTVREAHEIVDRAHRNRALIAESRERRTAAAGLTYEPSRLRSTV